MKANAYDVVHKIYHFVLEGKYYSKRHGMVDSKRFLQAEDKLSMSEAQSLRSIHNGGGIVQV